MKDQGLKAAIAQAGGASRLAELIGVSKQAISQWRRCPADRIVAVETASGVPREQLRPDLYRSQGEHP